MLIKSMGESFKIDLFEKLIHQILIFEPKGFHMTKLHKLLYFLEFNYLERNEEELTGEDFIKNHFGPTSKNLKKYLDILIGKGLITSIEDEKGREVYFSIKDKEYKFNSKVRFELEEMKKHFINLSTQEISDLSHKDNPFKITEDFKVIDKQAVFFRTKEFSVC